MGRINALKGTTVDNPLINCDETGQQFQSVRLISNVCLKNLNENCYQLECKFRHSLPSDTVVENNLETVSDRALKDSYRDLLLNYPPLFRAYFRTYCKHFGRRKDRIQLMSMIGDGLRQTFAIEEQQEHIESILLGFLESGMIYGTSVDIMIRKFAEQFADFRFQYVLLGIVMNERNNKITSHLNQFKNTFKVDQQLSSKLISKLIASSLGFEEDEILDFTLSILSSCSLNIFRQINKEDLKAFLKLCQMRGLKTAYSIYSKMSLS